MENVLFYAMAIIAVAAAGVVILHRNPVKSALGLIVVMLALAILFLQLTASFLAIIQIMVYAGAVMVLFLFILFLLNVGVEGPFAAKRFRRTIAVLIGTLMGLTLAGAMLIRSPDGLRSMGPPVPGDFGNIETAGELLFTRYLLPFELLSVLLLVAIIGAILATRPKWPVPKLPPELWPAGSDPAESGLEARGEE
jgi:NADH-quinone oxidoreductase subunit J